MCVCIFKIKHIICVVLINIVELKMLSNLLHNILWYVYLFYCMVNFLFSYFLYLCIGSINPEFPFMATCSGQRHFSIALLEEDRKDEESHFFPMEDNSVKLWKLKLPL